MLSTAGPQRADGGESAPPLATPAGRSCRATTARLLGSYVASRVLILVAALLAGLAHPGTTVTQFLSTWDGGWYLAVASHGYPARIPEIGGRATESTIGFFPLYPMLVRAASLIVPFSAVVVAILISTACGATVVLLFYRLARMFTDRDTAERAAILFAFFPGSFVLSMPYTEGLMLALAAVCFLALFQRRWWLAGLSAALATACRPTGLALAAACAWQAAVAIRQRREWRAIIAPLLAPTGVLAFFLFLKVRTGEFTAWLRVEKEGWKQGPKLGLWVFQPVARFLDSPFSNRRDTVVALGLLFAIVSLGVLLWQRWPGALNVYTLAILAMSANTRLDSVRPRALLTAFPLIFATAAAARGRRFAYVLAVSAGLLFVLALQYNTFQLDQI
ncbi:MAG: hypothetical protein QOD57_5486 [Actinomycetota bacterium]|nr:hypothetical protein [Actinomycetota bacterium]